MSSTAQGSSGPPSTSGLRAATTLAVWSAALAAGASADEAIDALAGTGMPHGARLGAGVAAESWPLPGPGEPHSDRAELLAFVRQGGPAQLILPLPGDLRGMPVGGAITLPALDAGAVVVLPVHGVGLVPADGYWRAYPCAAGHPALPERDARALVDGAIRDATIALSRLDVARGAGRPHDRVRAVMLAEEVTLPRATPPAAAALLAQSIALHALLTVAFVHETAAATVRQLGAVDEALTPLAAAVRESRRTAVAMAVGALHPAAAVQR